MTKKSQRIKKRTQAQMRESLDKVVALVRAESDRYLSPYDIACWIMYACDRSDAMLFSREDAEGIYPDEADGALKLTMEDELKEKWALWQDDSDAAYQLIETQQRLAEQFDKDYRKPILGQDDWLELQPTAREVESAEVLRRVVDNAIDSSRRAAKRRKK